MKTRVLHKQQKNIDFDKNLFNNQNYILWKTEKKKLLSKFFVEFHYNKILKILNYFYNIIFNWYLLFLVPIIIYYFLFSTLKDIPSQIFYWVILWIFSLIFFIYFFFIWSSSNKHNYKSIKEFLFKKWSNLNVVFILWFIKVSLYYFFIMTYLIDFLKMIGAWEVFTFFSFIISLFWWIFFMININLLNLFLFPFLLIYIIFYWSINYIKIFFKKNNMYRIIKHTFKVHLLKKFDKIDKKSAENKYYKIQQK